MNYLTYDVQSGGFVETAADWDAWIAAFTVSSFGGLIGFVMTGSPVFLAWSAVCSLSLASVVRAALWDIGRASLPAPLFIGRTGDV